MPTTTAQAVWEAAVPAFFPNDNFDKLQLAAAVDVETAVLLPDMLPSLKTSMPDQYLIGHNAVLCNAVRCQDLVWRFAFSTPVPRTLVDLHSVTCHCHATRHAYTHYPADKLMRNAAK